MLEIYSSIKFNHWSKQCNILFWSQPTVQWWHTYTQHQFSPAISRNLIVDFGYFHWTLLCPTNFLAEREKCFQNTKKEWGIFFEWSKSRQTTHNRFLCITVSLEKKLLTFWNIVVYHMYVKGFFQILSCTYVPFENPKIEFFSIQTRGISMWKLASKTASVHKYRRKWWIVQTFQFSMSIHISHSWKIQL